MRTGIVRSDEATRIGEEDSLDMFESNWFIPLKWSVEVLKGAQKEGLIKTPPGELSSFQQIKLRGFRLLSHDAPAV